MRLSPSSTDLGAVRAATAHLHVHVDRSSSTELIDRHRTRKSRRRRKLLRLHFSSFWNQPLYKYADFRQFPFVHQTRVCGVYARARPNCDSVDHESRTSPHRIWTRVRFQLPKLVSVPDCAAFAYARGRLCVLVGGCVSFEFFSGVDYLGSARTGHTAGGGHTFRFCVVRGHPAHILYQMRRAQLDPIACGSHLPGQKNLLVMTAGFSSAHQLAWGNASIAFPVPWLCPERIKLVSSSLSPRTPTTAKPAMSFEQSPSRPV